jgi:hypothetical protein
MTMPKLYLMSDDGRAVVNVRECEKTDDCNTRASLMVSYAFVNIRDGEGKHLGQG